MFLYQERFKAKLEDNLTTLNITDPRMVEWFRTTYMTHMRKNTNAHRALYLGNPQSGNHHNTLRWSEAPQMLRDAVMRDEDTWELRPDTVNAHDLTTIVRAMDQISVDNPSIESFSPWAYDALLSQGATLKKQDARREMLTQAAAAIKVMYIGTVGYDVVGLFNYAALDVAGHDLLNCLRGQTQKRNMMDDEVTYFAVRRYGKIQSIAEVKCFEAHESNTSAVRKTWTVTSNKGVSNYEPDAYVTNVLIAALTEIFGMPFQNTQLSGPRFRKVFKLKGNVPVLETQKGIDLPRKKELRHVPLEMSTAEIEARIAAFARAWQVPAWNGLRGLGQRTGKTMMVLDSLSMLRDEPVAEWQSPAAAEFLLSTPPEVKETRTSTVKVLKHRNAQRMLAKGERPIPNLLFNMTKRLTDDVYEHTTGNMVMTRRPVRVGSADVAGIVGIDPGEQEGDRTGLVRFTDYDTLVSPSQTPLFVRRSRANRTELGHRMPLGFGGPSLEQASAFSPLGTYTYRITSLRPDGSEIPQAEHPIQTATVEMQQEMSNRSAAMMRDLIMGTHQRADAGSVVYTGHPDQMPPFTSAGVSRSRGWMMYEAPMVIANPRSVVRWNEGATPPAEVPTANQEVDRVVRQGRGLTPGVRILDHMDLMRIDDELRRDRQARTSLHVTNMNQVARTLGVSPELLTHVAGQEVGRALRPAPQPEVRDDFWHLDDMDNLFNNNEESMRRLRALGLSESFLRGDTDAT